MGEEGLVLCRTCLSSVNKMFYFSDLIVPDHYLEFLDISFNQYTSKYICYLCLNILRKIMTFKEQCSVVNKLFIDLSQQLQDDSASAVISSPVFHNISQAPVVVQKLPEEDPEKALQTTVVELHEDVNDKPFEENITEEYLDNDSTEESILEGNVSEDNFLEGNITKEITLEENIEAKDKDTKMTRKANKSSNVLDVTKKLSLEDFNIIPYIKKNEDISNGKVDKIGSVHKVRIAKIGSVHKVGIAKKNLVVNDVNSNAKLNERVHKGVSKIAMAMARADLVVNDELCNVKVDKGGSVHKVGIPKRDLIVNRVSSGYSKTQSRKIKDIKEVKVVNFNDLFRKDVEKVQGGKNGTLNNKRSKEISIKNNVLNPTKGTKEFMMDLDMSVDEEDFGTNKYKHDDTNEGMEVEMLDEEIKTENEDDDLGSDENNVDDPLSIEVDQNSAELKDVANNNTKLFSRMNTIKDRIRALENFANMYSVDIKFLSREQQRAELRHNKKNLTYYKFLCNMCVLTFSDREGYENHMSLHRPGAGEFKCEVCFIRCKTKFLKFKHINEKHLKLFTCTRCGNTSKNKFEAKLHSAACRIKKRFSLTNQISTSKKISNGVCEQNLQSQGQDRQSIDKPGANGDLDACLYECEICAFIEFSDTALRKHKENVHINMVRCETCEREFANAAAIKIHREGEYCEFGYFPCLLCGMHYRSEFQARKHVLREHRQSYRCYTCNTEFKEEGSYRHHALSVHIPSENECDFCSKSFLNRQMMIAHRRSHTAAVMTHPDDRPYKCLQCHNSFKTAGNLEDHERFHKIAKPYSCGECGVAFEQSRDLTKHIKQHTAQRLVCEECKEEFLSNRILLRHMKSVHGAATDSAL